MSSFAHRVGFVEAKGDIPWPGEVHPFYADNHLVTEWVFGHMLGWNQQYLTIPVVPSFKLMPADETFPAAYRPMDRREMQRFRYWGLAPYVGDEFVYMWDVGTDDLGRHVAGFARQVYTTHHAS